MKYIICFLVAFAFIPNTYASSNSKQIMYECNDMTNQGTWLKLAVSPQVKQKPYLNKLKKCLFKNKDLQGKMDTMASGYLDMYPELYEKFSIIKRKNYLYFIANTFLAGANAGYASSQHNYAIMHNNAPDNIINKYIKQDYAIFIEWTCKAVAQKEPRAIFNLAMRSSSPQKIPFIKKDKNITYLLLKQAEKNSNIYTELSLTKELIKKEQEKILLLFSLQEQKSLNSQLKYFDFSNACVM